MNSTMLPAHIVKPNPFIYLSDNYLVVDTESTSLDKGSAINSNNEMVAAVWGRNGKYKRRYGNQYEMEGLLNDISSASFLVMQNAKHDLQWLQRCGLDLSKVIVYDTMLGKYVEDGNTSLLNKQGLNFLSAHYGVGKMKSNIISRMFKAGIDTSIIPKSWLLDYCERDVEITENIFIAQRGKLAGLGLLPVLYTRCLFTPVLADIEFNGMHLDPAVVRKEYVVQKRRQEQIQLQLQEMAGEGINLNSSKQLSNFIYNVLKFEPPKRFGRDIVNKKGDYPTDAATLEKLKAKTKKQSFFLALNKERSKVGARLSKNLDFFLGVVEEYSSIFYGSFNQNVTVTHRLSSSGRPLSFKTFGGKKKSVQFQNMPRLYKPLFSPREEGWFMCEIDQAQLEFRIAGFMSKEVRIYQEIKEKYDVHSFTASTLNAVDLDWILKNKNSDAKAAEMRTEAKKRTFKPLYGGKSGTEEEQVYYAAFRDKYPLLSKTQEGWTHEVLRTGKLVLPTGLIVYWPDTRLLESGYILNTPAIYNLPIQNLATAEIVPLGVIYQWHRMKAGGLESFLVNTVHDSSVGEVHPDEKERYEEIGIQAFTDDVIFYLKEVYGIDMDMPLEAEVTFGKWWGSKVCKTCKEEYNPLVEHACLHNAASKKEMGGV